MARTDGSAKKEGKRKGDFLAGKYLLEDLLGVGGMGEVYRATNVSLGRKVAIKLLSSEYVGIEDDVNRFLREARAAAAVRHSNVVDVLDVAREDDGTPFIVQELLSGEDLENYLKTRGGTISPDETLEIMIPVADAVAAAHAQKVVHRDLKPANIFLARERNKITPKVLDFGAALYQTMGERSAKEARLLIGTPHYMAPEQIISKSEVDARSDVWALGVILYEMMVGETPFEAETAGAVLNKVKSTNVPLLRTRLKTAPPELEAVVAKCTDRERAKRYPDAGAVRDALEEVRRTIRGAPQSSRLPTMEELPVVGKKEPPRVAPAAPRPGLLTLSSPDDEPPPRAGDSFDIPLPMETLHTPSLLTPAHAFEPRRLPEPASARHPIGETSDIRPRLDPSGVRSLGDHPPPSLDLTLSPPKSSRPPASRATDSSLPPVLFTSAAAKPVTPMPASAPIPLELREDLRSSQSRTIPKEDLRSSQSRALPREDLTSSRSMPKTDTLSAAMRPVGPLPVRADFAAIAAKRVAEQPPWSPSDTVKLGVHVAIPAILIFLAAGLLPVLSQPVRHALLGDSAIASGVTTIVALVLAAGLCARAALLERTRLSWVTAGAAVLFGIAMIILTFGASDIEAGESASTLSMATVIGPLTPLLLAFAALTKARDYWKDPYSKSEARRGAALASVFLFLTLAVSPFGAVRAPPRPMHAIESMLKHPQDSAQR